LSNEGAGGGGGVGNNLGALGENAVVVQHGPTGRPYLKPAGVNIHGKRIETTLSKAPFFGRRISARQADGEEG